MTGAYWDHVLNLAVKTGAKAAGRVLDGRTWDELPAVTRAGA